MFVSRPWRVAAALIVASLVTAPAALAQRRDDKKDQGKDQSKLTEPQRQELSPLVRTVDEVMKTGTAGTFAVTMNKENVAQLQPDQAAIPLTWKNDSLKATGNLIYVPFTLTIDTSKPASGADAKAPGSSIAGYLRVVPKGTGSVNMGSYEAIRDGMTYEAVAAILGSKGTEGASGGRTKVYTWSAPSGGGNMSITFTEGVVSTKAQSGLPPLSFEDVYFTELRTTPQGLKLTRAFAVPAGDYDAYIALRERPLPGSKPAANTPIRIGVLKQEVTVPNYWANEFTTSSLILADKVEPLNAPLSPDAQRERPYVLGATEIIPAPDNKFKKTEELGVIFQVYGYQLGGDKKPDVQIEYMFHQKDAAGGEKPFNKTEPQKFNAQTLPPTFDPEQGHQIVGGQMIPLASFPEGDFRLEIKVTDNKATKTITREVLFSVVPAS